MTTAWSSPPVRMSDPFSYCGPLCTSMVLSYLDAKSLMMTALVCRSWRALTYSDSALWGAHCQELWRDKEYIPQHIRDASCRRAAYSQSIADGQRTVITEEELCQFTWAFSFKLPGWFSDSLSKFTIKRFFNVNHTVTAPDDDPLWGGIADPPRHYWYVRHGADGKRLIQVNSYPPLSASRTAGWSWQLDNAMVQLVVDHGAGSNPGLPPDHPAAGQPMTTVQIEAMFSAWGLDGMDSDSDQDRADADAGGLLATGELPASDGEGAGEEDE